MGGEAGGTNRHAQPPARGGHPGHHDEPLPLRCKPSNSTLGWAHHRAWHKPALGDPVRATDPRAHHPVPRSSPRTRRGQTSPTSPRQEKRHRTPSTSISSRSSSPPSGMDHHRLRRQNHCEAEPTASSRAPRPPQRPPAAGRPAPHRNNRTHGHTSPTDHAGAPAFQTTIGPNNGGAGLNLTLDSSVSTLMLHAPEPSVTPALPARDVTPLTIDLQPFVAAVHLLMSDARVIAEIASTPQSQLPTAASRLPRPSIAAQLASIARATCMR